MIELHPPGSYGPRLFDLTQFGTAILESPHLGPVALTIEISCPIE